MSKEPKDAKQEMRQISRKSFMWAGFAVLGGYSTIKYLSTRLTDGGTPWPFRRVLEFNESVWKDFYQPKPVHEFAKADVTPLEMTTELCCIEGWSSIVSWAGVRFSDFMKKHPPATKSGEDPNIAKNPTDLMDYIYLETPDAGYYVGLDMPSALHPNTILCYEMNGEPLPLEHGAPLRLVIPVKYGIKNIKRIGTIRYTNARPADYWAEEGYDWYAGL